MDSTPLGCVESTSLHIYEDQKEEDDYELQEGETEKTS